MAVQSVSLLAAWRGDDGRGVSGSVEALLVVAVAVVLLFLLLLLRLGVRAVVAVVAVAPTVLVLLRRFLDSCSSAARRT